MGGPPLSLFLILIVGGTNRDRRYERAARVAKGRQGRTTFKSSLAPLQKHVIYTPAGTRHRKSEQIVDDDAAYVSAKRRAHGMARISGQK